MMKENDVLIAMQEAVRQGLCEMAKEEIEKARVRFECEMGKVKREMVCKIVNQIQISASHTLPTGEYVIQIRLNGGGKNV